jgi:ribonuclease P/MRP protein subunit POP1
MKEDNTPTVTKRRRTPSRKLRLRLDTAHTLKKVTQKRKTVRQKKKGANANAQPPDPKKHVLTMRVPRSKKNTLARAPTATTKYKRRQVNKTWLPTHLWHTKRAHMPRPTEPLWRMAIPLSPTEKSYRPSHRASGAQGCIAWDTSYTSTVACTGTEIALESLLKGFSFTPQGLSAVMQKKWRLGSRFASGWVHQQQDEKLLIGPATVLWSARHVKEGKVASTVGAEIHMDSDGVVQQEANAAGPQPDVDKDVTTVSTTDQMDCQKSSSNEPKKQATRRKTKLDHQILIRVHPSIFHQFWQELLKIAKAQKPQVLVEDLRFEIGSIEIQGPGSTEALLGVLRPFPMIDARTHSTPEIWTMLAGLNNPGILPQNAIMPLEVVDPRLNHPPKQIRIPPSSEMGRLNDLLVSWPLDTTCQPFPLLSHKTRWLISTSMPSQKAINRRRTLAPPGEPPSITAKDPHIPALLLASRAEGKASSNAQGTWTVLLPWSCVDPVWRALMYYPLSSGGTPRFGGLSQKQQLAFEKNVPWFPGDFPGTEAGKAWERTENEKRFDTWIRRPPKHRIAWDKLDLGHGRRGELGRGWACDWEHLFLDTNEPDPPTTTHKADILSPDTSSKEAPLLLTQRQRKAAKARAEEESERLARRRNTSSPESEGEAQADKAEISGVSYTQLSPVECSSLLKANPSKAFPTQPALVAIQITLLDKGTPSPAARVYRFPTKPPEKVVPASTQATGNDSTKSQESGPASWPSDGPPPAQPNPASTTDLSASSAPKSRSEEIVARWLAIGATPSAADDAVRKVKVNKLNLPRRHAAYPRESLAKINVLPKNAPQEIIDKWGPESEFGRGNGEVPKQKPPPPKVSTCGQDKGKEKLGTSKEQGFQLGTETKNLPTNHPVDAHLNPFTAPTEWDKHPPCPDAHDLIGFVTSGGYNLAEGRGTAIGSIWIQRVLQGWQAVDRDVTVPAKQKDKRKRLCIVRNAGEGVGRLGIWEVCG